MTDNPYAAPAFQARTAEPGPMNGSLSTALVGQFDIDIVEIMKEAWHLTKGAKRSILGAFVLMIGVSGMATALLTTLYGAMAANMVFIPMAGKLEQRAKEEALLRELMIEGIVAIQSGDGPQLIKEKLKSFIPPSTREAVAAG